MIPLHRTIRAELTKGRVPARNDDRTQQVATARHDMAMSPPKKRGPPNAPVEAGGSPGAVPGPCLPVAKKKQPKKSACVQEWRCWVAATHNEATLLNDGTIVAHKVCWWSSERNH